MTTPDPDDPGELLRDNPALLLSMLRGEQGAIAQDEMPPCLLMAISAMRGPTSFLSAPLGFSWRPAPNCALTLRTTSVALAAMPSITAPPDFVPEEIPRPDVSAIVTEDDTPVDNFPSEKEQRLLTESLYSSWSGPKAGEGEGPRPFLVAANVGVFSTASQPPLVPDVLLALDVTLQSDWWKKENRSYFIWEMGKTPDVAVEIVSNREGHEMDSKLRRYAAMRIPYYVVWDPVGYCGAPGLYSFELQGLQYVPMDRAWFDHVGLGLKVWEGVYEGHHAHWLRWHTADEAIVLTGAERAEAEKQRATRLAARLRELGINPDDV